MITVKCPKCYQYQVGLQITFFLHNCNSLVTSNLQKKLSCIKWNVKNNMVILIKIVNTANARACTTPLAEMIGALSNLIKTGSKQHAGPLGGTIT